MHDDEVLCDDDWHTIYVVKNRNTASMAVDGGELRSVATGGELVSVDRTFPLTVGRIPGSYY